MKTVSTSTMYGMAGLTVISLVSLGYQAPVEQQDGSASANNRAIEVENPSVDQVIATGMAASVAQVADLSVATNASNLSISVAAKTDLSQTDDSVFTKPTIIQPDAQRRGISSYKVAVGDTVQSVAKRHGVSAETIKWANDLTTDTLTPNTTLQIPGVDGVVYTVAEGDSIESLAKKFNADQSRVVSYNDLEISGLKNGAKIVIPGGVLPRTERPGYTEPQSQPTYNYSAPVAQPTFTANASSVGNRYDYGYCTWYAYNRRAELGRPIGSFWGNAVSWAGYASASGYRVDNTPAVGAIMQNGGGWGGYGHVAVVESVAGNGDVTVSEMNYAGWNVISSRTVPASQARSYNYIH